MKDHPRHNSGVAKYVLANTTVEPSRLVPKLETKLAGFRYQLEGRHGVGATTIDQFNSKSKQQRQQSLVVAVGSWALFCFGCYNKYSSILD